MRKIVAGLMMSVDGVVEAPETWTGPYFSPEIGQAVIPKKITQQVHRMAVQLGGKLYPANQLHARLRRQRHGLVVTLKGVVVGDSERVHAAADGFLNEFREVALFHALGAQIGAQGVIGLFGPGDGQTGFLRARTSHPSS